MHNELPCCSVRLVPSLAKKFGGRACMATGRKSATPGALAPRSFLAGECCGGSPQTQGASPRPLRKGLNGSLHVRASRSLLGTLEPICLSLSLSVLLLLFVLVFFFFFFLLFFPSSGARRMHMQPQSLNSRSEIMPPAHPVVTSLECPCSLSDLSAHAQRASSETWYIWQDLHESTASH